MLNITFVVAFLSFTSSNSSINGSSEAEKIPENNQNSWSFTFANLPTFGWLYEQIYTPKVPDRELNPKDESQSTKSVAQIEDLDIEEISDEPKSPKKVDDIMEIIMHSSDEEKKSYLPFLETFYDRITNNPKRYAKVFVKNMWHVVDLGIFKSGERRRNAERVRGVLEIIRDIIYAIFQAIYNFFVGGYEAAKVNPDVPLPRPRPTIIPPPPQIGAQNGFADYERILEGDHRRWTEQEALQRLEELETQYLTMDKETLVKDITSLHSENVVEQDRLDTAFNYVVRYFIDNIAPKKKNYKGQFAKDHNFTGIQNLPANDHNFTGLKDLPAKDHNFIGM